MTRPNSSVRDAAESIRPVFLRCESSNRCAYCGELGRSWRDVFSCRKVVVVFSSLSASLLALIFVSAAGSVWFAGVRLSTSTDALSKRLGFGEALGGLILLAVATNLPEIAITAAASLAGDLGIAIGNILGGIAVQTVVLAVLDAAGSGIGLSRRAISLVLVLEGVLVMAILATVVMAAQLPAGLTVFRLDPGAVAIAVLWITGLLLLNKARGGLPWKSASSTDSNGQPEGSDGTADDGDLESTRRAVVVFIAAAVVTLVGGVVLERSGALLADDLGMSGVFFAATILAAATSLPELSTGLASLRIGDVNLAFSDIFGGNAFLPVLFLEGSLLSGTSVLSQARPSDLYLASLGALLSAVYIVGLVFRPKRQVWRLGPDSLTVLILYAIGIIGLISIGSG